MFEAVELGFSDRFDLYFDPQTSVVEEDLALYRLESEARELDLRECLGERVQLALSDYPLCGDDCRGLCTRCGVDQNIKECNCSDTEPDPRWGPLMALQAKSKVEDNG